MSCSYKSVSFEDMLSTFEITVNMQLLFKKKNYWHFYLENLLKFAGPKYYLVGNLVLVMKLPSTISAQVPSLTCGYRLRF